MTVTELQADILGSLEQALVDGWDHEDAGRSYMEGEPEYDAALDLQKKGLVDIAETGDFDDGTHWAHFVVLDAGMSGGTWTVEEETVTVRNRSKKKASKKKGAKKRPKRAATKKPKKGLHDAQALHRKFPKTFEVPSAARLDAVKKGDHIKAAVKVGGKDNPEAERMWFKVVQKKGQTYVAVLDNEPGWPDVHGLKLGDKVSIHRKNVYDVMPASKGGFLSRLGLSMNPAQFKPGDLVRKTPEFMRSIGQYTGPVNGMVIGRVNDSVLVVWSDDDRAKAVRIHAANVELDKRAMAQASKQYLQSVLKELKAAQPKDTEQNAVRKLDPKIWKKVSAEAQAKWGKGWKKNTGYMGWALKAYKRRGGRYPLGAVKPEWPTPRKGTRRPPEGRREPSPRTAAPGSDPFETYEPSPRTAKNRGRRRNARANRYPFEVAYTDFTSIPDTGFFSDMSGKVEHDDHEGVLKDVHIGYDGDVMLIVGYLEAREEPDYLDDEAAEIFSSAVQDSYHDVYRDAERAGTDEFDHEDAEWFPKEAPKGLLQALRQQNPGRRRAPARRRNMQGLKKNRNSVISIGPRGQICGLPGPLKSKERYALPDWAFGLPGDGARSSRKYPLYVLDQQGYPVPSKTHAINAKARAKQQLEKKNLSRAEYNKIVKMANEVIKKCKKAPSRRGQRVAAAANPNDTAVSRAGARLRRGGPGASSSGQLLGEVSQDKDYMALKRKLMAEGGGY